MTEYPPGSASRDQRPAGPPLELPGYGYPPSPPTEALATAALVIAIAGFFICPPVGAIVALILASGAKRRIEASGGRLSGLEQARAARIIAVIELVLTAVVVLLLAIGAVVAVNTTGGEDESQEVPTSVSALPSVHGG
jgi:hypothetical protein